MSSRRKLHFLGWVGYGVLGLVFAVLVTLLVIRYFGLPDQMNRALAEELERRGLTVQFERLYLDPLGRVVARNLKVLQESPATPNTLLVDEVRFNFNWVSWWRGDPFLEAVHVTGADLRFPLSEDEVIHLRDVELVVEMTPDGYEIENGEARILNLKLEVEGRIMATGMEAAEPEAPTAEEMEKRAALWRKVEDQALLFSTESPINVRLEFDWIAEHPDRSEARLMIGADSQVWNGVILDEVRIEAGWLDGQARMDGEIQLLRGGLKWQGNWNYGTEEARVSVISDADLSLVSPAIPGQVGGLVSQARFRVLPVNEAEVVLNWEEAFDYHVRLRSEWIDFSIGGSRFERLVLPCAYDGSRWIVSDMELKHPSGTVRLNAFHDAGGQVRGDIESTLDPTVLKPFAGEGAQPFLNSLKFGSGGPAIRCSFRGPGFDFEKFVLQGNADASDFLYKGVSLKRIQSSFTLEDGAIHLPDLRVEREEGSGSGNVWHSFREKMVEIKDVKTRLNLQETARIIGDKMEEYARPYQFLEAPYSEAEGRVDLKTQETTDLKVYIRSPKGMRYQFLGRMLTLADIDTDLRIRGDRLSVRPRKPVTIFDGEMEGGLDVRLVEDASYDADLNFKDLDFGKLMNTFFDNEEVTGELDGEIEVTGRFADLASLTGSGKIEIRDGVLYPIPIFGTFSEILNSMVPELGYSQADKAQSAFVIRNGLIRTEKIDVYSTAFALIGNGSYHMIRDEVDMSMRVNIRGPLGLFTFPFSKLFEYRGTGSLDNTKWEPKSF